MIEIKQIKTDFEKLVIAKQYINYQKKRMQELEKNIYENSLLIEELRLEGIIIDKQSEVTKVKKSFTDRFLAIDSDYMRVLDFINNEIEPKTVNLLYLYVTLCKLKIRTLKKEMKKYYDGSKISIGRFTFEQ
ncbi:MAG: hypothetical protein KAT05_17725 [Spirochaetes bacterium]|nr:hypothetical protein [Spirochaetota bacterium]